VKDDGGGDDGDFAGTVVFFARDGSNDVVLELDAEARFFLGGDIGELAVGIAGMGVVNEAVVFLLFGDDVVPLAGFTLTGLLGFGFGGFTQGESDLLEGHADGDVFLGDEFLDDHLAFVELFQVGDEVFIFGCEELRIDPSGNSGVGGFTFNAIGFVCDGEQLDLRAGFEYTESATAFFGGIGDGGFGYEQSDGVIDVFADVNDIGVVVEKGFFGCCRGGEDDGGGESEAGGGEFHGVRG